MENANQIGSRAVEELLEQLYIAQVENGVPEGGAPAGTAGQSEAGSAAAGSGVEAGPSQAPGQADAVRLPPLPVEAIEEAREGGYVQPADGGPVLTPRGREAARSVVRRHRLAECLLRDVLGVGEADLDADACEFEHIIQHGLDEKICLLLGHPAQCPHGRPIPPGDCCRRAPKDAFRDVGPLSEGPLDTEGVVAYLHTQNRREVQKLMALGVLPGVSIRLLRRSPSYVFQLGYSQFTVDRELAQKIHVRWAGPVT